MTDTLLDEIEAFLRLTGMKPTRFSALATSDRHFVRHLRIGKRNVWPHTAAKVRSFMRNYDPKRNCAVAHPPALSAQA
jgi:hypothetical protein